MIVNCNGMSVFMPDNETFDLEDTGCYISYLRDNRDFGCDTTALVRMDGVRPSKFLILNGDHRTAYKDLKSYPACVEYFKAHLEQKNKYSENWDEEIITRPDGSIYRTKVNTFSEISQDNP